MARKDIQVGIKVRTNVKAGVKINPFSWFGSIGDNNNSTTTDTTTPTTSTTTTTSGGMCGGPAVG